MLTYEKILDRKWKKLNAYRLSKLYVVMFTKAFKYLHLISKNTTLINSCPGPVYSTSCLINNHGKNIIHLNEATHTYQIATEQKYKNPGRMPKYFKCTEPCDPRSFAREEKNCVELYEYLHRKYNSFCKIR